MATFEPLDHILKNHLESSYIQISGITCEMQQPYQLATLIIDKFYHLKNDIVYIKHVPDLDIELLITKKRTQLTIIISASNLGAVSGSILYEDTKTSKPVFAQQLTAKGQYLIEFSSSAVENAQNKYLKQGKLTIHFKLQESAKILNRMHACSRRGKTTEEILVENLKSVCTYPHFTDIILHVDKRKIHIPKGLLGARSEYLKEYPDTEDEITLNTDYEAVFSAVKYLYTGEIPSMAELNEQEICRIMEVASSLKIHSLLSKCLSYINALMIQGDAEGIHIENKCIVS